MGGETAAAAQTELSFFRALFAATESENENERINTFLKKTRSGCLMSVET